MESAVFRCAGETVGKVRMARGPERRGVKAWDFFFEKTAVWAARESAWVSAGSVGEGVVLGMAEALDWVDGSSGSDDGGTFEEDGEGSQYSTTLRAAEKMRD